MRITVSAAVKSVEFVAVTHSRNVACLYLESAALSLSE